MSSTFQLLRIESMTRGGGFSDASNPWHELPATLEPDDRTAGAMNPILARFDSNATLFFTKLNQSMMRQAIVPWAVIMFADEYPIFRHLTEARGNVPGLWFAPYSPLDADGRPKGVGALIARDKTALHAGHGGSPILTRAWEALRDRAAQRHWLCVLNPFPRTWVERCADAAAAPALTDSVDRQLERAQGSAFAFSPANPVLCNGPAGERAYLNRLRCPLGHRFQCVRLGVTSGRCTRGGEHIRVPSALAPEEDCLIDQYELRCEGGEFACSLYFDMYHAKPPRQPAPTGLRDADASDDGDVVEIELEQEGEEVVLEVEDESEASPAPDMTSRYPRILTTDAAAAIRTRSGPLYQAMLRVSAELNPGLRHEDAVAGLHEMLGPTCVADLFANAWRITRFPDVVQLDRQRIAVLEGHPLLIALCHRGFSAQRASLDQLAGGEPGILRLRAQHVAEGGDGEEFDDYLLFRFNDERSRIISEARRRIAMQ